MGLLKCLVRQFPPLHPPLLLVPSLPASFLPSSFPFSSFTVLRTESGLHIAGKCPTAVICPPIPLFWPTHRSISLQHRTEELRNLGSWSSHCLLSGALSTLASGVGRSWYVLDGETHVGAVSVGGILAAGLQHTVPRYFPLALILILLLGSLCIALPLCGV